MALRRSVSGRVIAATALCLPALTAAPTSAALQAHGARLVAGHAATAASAPIRARVPDWRRYLLGPDGPEVRPVRVVSTSGGVDNAAALTGRRPGTLRLTKVAGGTDPVAVLDYGRNVGGFPFFRVGALRGHPTLRAAYAEALPYLGPSGDNTVLTGAFGEDLHRYDSYRVDSAGTIENPRIQGAERFQEIRLTTPGTVTLSGVGIRYSSLRTAYPGHFLSSSPMLNRTWYQSAYTVQLDTLPPNSEPGVGTPPVIVDGAKRDRKVWGGDLLTAAQNVYYSTGATAAVKGSLEVLARLQSPQGEISGQATQSQNDYWSAAYSMTWVAALAEYYRYTGDLRFVRDQWRTVRRELAWNASNVDARGLLITNGWTWHPVDGATFQGAITADNALYYHVLRSAAGLARSVGRRREALSYRRSASRVRSSINRTLFNRAAGEYDISDTRRNQTAQDANALAVLYGVAPRNRVSGILEALRTTLWTAHGPLAFSVNTGLLGAYSATGERVPAISPFSSSLELWARMAAGDADGGLALLRTLWGPMTDPHDPYYTGTTAEILNPDGRPGFGSVTSMSHAWSAGAAPALSGYVLGVRPQSAGYHSWTVEPQVAGLAWAQGRVPTPYGPLVVKWRSRRGSFAIRCTTPAQTSGTVAVPRPGAGATTVRVGGHIVWDRRGFHRSPGIPGLRGAHSESGRVYLDLSGGAGYAIEAVSRRR
jgi:Bacterial alpha-L-rhamnosidase 6 hairpin glycosidase domain/Bacterial alpha-L-rhamnosidase C-terminal domain